MPYTLFYSDEIITGDINYQKETTYLTIKTNLYGSSSSRVWARSVEQALQAVNDGLEATGQKNKWGLNWPNHRVTNLNAFRRQGRTFNIAAELVNSENKVIGRQELKVGGYWEYYVYNRPGVSISADGRNNVRFSNVNANDITDNLTIRFASVNGEAAETAAQKGVLQIKAMRKSEFDMNDQFTFMFGEIKDYKGTGGNLVITDIWDDPVISISKDVFNNKGLTSVIIPNSVTFIDKNAFYKNELTYVIIGENVTLGQNVFGNGIEAEYKIWGRRAGTYIRDPRYDSGKWVLKK
jgi:hypothetical protein